MMTSPARGSSSQFPVILMSRNCLILVALFGMATAPGTAQQAADPHLSEPGTAVLVSRSAFAHGYRHGYEAGYHWGNIDVNMARPQKAKPALIKGISIGYQPVFGPKHSFERGFRSGLKAGYSDGYAGKNFRAVAEFRSLAASLNPNADSVPDKTYFDNGVLAGYSRGLDRHAQAPSSSPLDFHLVTCPQTTFPSNHSDLQQIFCEGYQRGFALGRADGAVLGPEHGLLEASR